MLQVMTGQLVVIIIVGGGTVIAPVMHGDECKETQVANLPGMLEIMAEQLRHAQQLAYFGIPGEVNTDQNYDQGLFYHLTLNIQK